MEDKLKILIVDNSPAYRQILTKIFTGIKNTELLGTASNGNIALLKIEMSPPDLLLLDVSISEMDELETLKIVREKYPDTDVIILSGANTGNANLTVKALNLGALDFIIKPGGISREEAIYFLKSSLNPMISLVITRKYSRMMTKLSPGTLKPEIKSRQISATHSPKKNIKTVITNYGEKRKPGRIQAIGLGVSTGGPNALQQIIPFLGKELRVPIFAVQHMPPMFTTSLADRLNKESNIEVVEAIDGEIISPGKMFIAPGGFHMVVQKWKPSGERIGIIDTPPVNNCKPSIDVLFHSMAMAYNGCMLTVILTGMGTDGASGVSALRQKGGYSIVQDEATSVVWGMPQAVLQANDADEVLPLEKIAQRIMEIVG